MGNYQLGTECVSTFDFNQFQPGESLDQCGPAAVALCHFMGAPGHPTTGSTTDALHLMMELYTEFIGPDVPSDTGGTSNATLYAMLAKVGNHYQNLFPDGGVSGSDTQFGCPQWSLKDHIRKWVGLGYPVIIGVTEDSILDMGLHRRPYDWNTSGLDHIICVTGVAQNNIDLLVRDTANILAAGPREYAVTPLVLLSATVVVPGNPMWLERPVDTDPAHQPAPAPAPETQLQKDLAQLEADAAAMVAEASKVEQETKTVAQEAAPLRMPLWNGVGTPLPGQQ